jgi:ubiquitin C-terminal hydrolase
MNRDKHDSASRALTKNDFSRDANASTVASNGFRASMYPFASPSDGRIQGIPNYGQTCFLNVVLQCLASLDPFVVYLSHVASLTENDTSTTGGGRSKGSSGKVLSQELLHVIQCINGTAKNSTRRLDPRPILQHAAKENNEFASATLQQDAHELLQAVLCLVAKDAGLTKLSSTRVTSFARLISIRNDGKECGDEDDECQNYYIVTVVTAAKEKQRRIECCIETTAAITDGETLEKRQPETKTKAENGQNGDRQEERGVVYDDSRGPFIYTEGMDEKKQEDDSIQLDSFRIMAPETSITKASREYPLSLSATLMRMIASTSSTNPSPIGGWLGSALKCRSCDHHRPIQNSSFVNIPIIPTEISLTRTEEQRSRGGCKLEQCLEEFTGIERVHDVECLSCTRNKAILDLEVKIKALESDIFSLEEGREFRNARRSGTETLPVDDLTNSLRNDLKTKKCRLHLLRCTSPDNDEALERLLSSGSLASPEASEILLERSDAFKRVVITRLPAILCLHVQRLYYDADKNRKLKSSQQVMFPEQLDLAPYFAYSGQEIFPVDSGDTVSVTAPVRSPQPLRYTLRSVITHAGSAFSGHYYAYRRDPKTPHWLYISDEVTKRVSWDIVRNTEAYMLFYEAKLISGVDL